MINNLDTLRKKQDQINAGMAKYGPAVAAQRQTAEAQLKILESSVETIGVRIGLALLPPLTKFARFLSSDLIPGDLAARRDARADAAQPGVRGVRWRPARRGDRARGRSSR